MGNDIEVNPHSLFNNTSLYLDLLDYNGTGTVVYNETQHKLASLYYYLIVYDMLPLVLCTSHILHNSNLFLSIIGI